MAKVYVFNKSTGEVVKVVEAPTADACLEQLKLEGGIDESVFGVAQTPPADPFVPVPAVEGDAPAVESGEELTPIDTDEDSEEEEETE